MEAEFWHKRWQSGRIGFHQGQVNRMLERYHDRLPVAAGARFFVPLCGKTRDIAWLLEQGYRVAGAELSGLAIGQLFDEMGLTAEVTQHGPLRRHAAQGVEVFEGDIFDLDAETLGPIDAVFDRAALVALPEEVRGRYCAHLSLITANAPQLLVSFVYDQSAMSGPPFSVPDAEIFRHYRSTYEISLLADVDVEGGLKGICPAREKAWLLMPAQSVSG